MTTKAESAPSLVRATLRTKFLLSLTLISALLSSAVLWTVQYRVRLHARDEIGQALRDSVVTFQSLQQQREASLASMASLLATLPPLKAVMTSEDPATIQDASATFWQLTHSQIFALADRSGRLVALHTAAPDFAFPAAAMAMQRTLTAGTSRDWWYGNGHLFEVFVERIDFGPPETARTIGVLAVGYEVDAGVAADVTRVASSQVGFAYEKNLVIGTVPLDQRDALAEAVARRTGVEDPPHEMRLGAERFLATTVRLSSPESPLVTLTLLKSVDRATAFLQNLDRWIIAIGVTAVAAGALLGFVVSTTFTRPLARLVAGVRALETGDFAFPLDLRGSDEVSALTAAFDRMRRALLDTQRRLLEAEQLATIGRLARGISHDLRHPLTAVLAYAEFLSERDLSDDQRKDFFEEIRIAVNRMIDELNSLLGFAKEEGAVRLAYDRFDTVIDRAIKAVHALPEFASTTITLRRNGDGLGWFDPAKLERVMMNLLLNAAEAVPADTGRIDVCCVTSDAGTEIRVSDNGPGIPSTIVDSLFQPFVSHGKEKGIGLGLTVVQSIMRQHDGDVSVEQTGPGGTTFRLFLPAHVPQRTDAAVA